MSKTITLRDATPALARCIRHVEAGEKYVITRGGRPIARLVPIAARRILSPEQTAARARARARMEQGWPIARPLDRGSLHDR